MTTHWCCGDWEVICEATGGRLASVRWQGRELLTQPHLPGGRFQPPTPDWGLYETRPVFGFDDCWPSLDPSPWPGAAEQIRDHGELVWREWRLRVTPDQLQATVADEAGGWEFTRVLSCAGPRLQFDYRCHNGGPSPLPMNWAGHALLPPHAVCSLRLPQSLTIRQEYPVASDLGQDSEALAEQLLRLPEGESRMVILVQPATCELVAVLAGCQWTLRLEGAGRPALGLWMNQRGYPQPSALARAELGLEWMLCDRPALAEGVADGTAPVLPAGGEITWRMIWEMSRH